MSLGETDTVPTEAIGRTVLAGGAWAVVGRVLPLTYTFVVSIVAARVLGPAVMGQLALITFAAASVTMLLSAAPAASLNRAIGEALGRGETDAVRALVRWAWLAGITLALATMLVFAGFAAFAGSYHEAWLLAGVWSATTILHAVPYVFLGGAQRWREATIVGLSTGVVHVVASVGVLAAGGGVTALLAVDAAIGAVNVIGTTLLARRLLGRLARPSPATTDLRAPIVRYALGTAPAVVLAYVIERRSELFFLAVFATTTQVALYSIPFTAVSVLALVPASIGVVTATAMATLLGSRSHARIHEGHERAVRLTLLLALPATAAGLTVGPDLLSAVYGQEYAGAEPVLVILVSALPLIVLTALEIALLQGLGQVRGQVLVYASAGAANVTLALLLVPPLEAVGAALAHSGAYVVAVAVAIRAAPRAASSIARGLRPLAPAAVASAAAGGAALALGLLADGGFGVAVAPAGGLVVFFTLARLLRIVPRQDATWIAGHVDGPMRRLVLGLSTAPRQRAVST